MRTIPKKILCMVLMTALLASICGLAVCAEPLPERKTLMKGTYTLYTLTGETIEEDYFYSDSFFDGSSKISNPHLKTVSAAVSFSLNDLTRESAAANSVLRRIGFSDIVMEDMDHTAADSIGTVIAQKRIGDSTVVALMLRGYDYGSEWASNFLCGSEGDARGFLESSEKALARLGSYLTTYHITDAKIWVTGYSRSAAVANLVGKALNENTVDYSTAEDDIYVYAFEAPNCDADGVVYENIHNVIDSRDLITYVYPAGWGLSRCGVTEPIGDDSKMIMSKKFALLGENLMVDFKEVNLAEFLDEYFDFLSQYISRETYVNELEAYLCSLSDIFLSMSDEEKEELGDFFNKFLEDFMTDESLPTVLVDFVWEKAGDKDYEAFVNLVTSNLDKAYVEVESPLTDEQFETLKSAVHPLVFTLKPAIKADAAMRKQDKNGKEKKVTLYYLMTLLGNIEEIIGYHIYDSVYDYLMDADSYYGENNWMKIGDADGDGTVTVLDATAVQKDLAKLYVIDEDRLSVSDADYDGSITVLDATSVQKYLAALGNPYHIDEYLLS